MAYSGAFSVGYCDGLGGSGGSGRSCLTSGY